MYIHSICMHNYCNNYLDLQCFACHFFPQLDLGTIYWLCHMTCMEQDVVLYVFIHVVIDTYSNIVCAVILFSYVTFGFWAWHVTLLRGRSTFVVYCVMCTCVG